MYGFAKNKKDNITSKELESLKLLASKLLNYSKEEIKKAIKEEELVEVENE